jgi:uncharacterized protein YndB with AHSA1/START domain
MVKVLIIAGLIIGAIVGLIAAATLIGLFLPRQHAASRTIRLPASPETLWAIITDRAAYPSWRRGVARVERRDDRNGHEVWAEINRRGEAMPLETVESAPPRRLVTRIADDSLPFGGAWTWELSPAGEGSTELRITEDGFIKPPAFRTVMRLMGHDATIRQVERDLVKRVGAASLNSP